jgi:hypothetical protein
LIFFVAAAAAAESSSSMYIGRGASSELFEPSNESCSCGSDSWSADLFFSNWQVAVLIFFS